MRVFMVANGLKANPKVYNEVTEQINRVRRYTLQRWQEFQKPEPRPQREPRAPINPDMTSPPTATQARRRRRTSETTITSEDRIPAIRPEDTWTPITRQQPRPAQPAQPRDSVAVRTSPTQARVIDVNGRCDVAGCRCTTAGADTPSSPGLTAYARALDLGQNAQLALHERRIANSREATRQAERANAERDIAERIEIESSGCPEADRSGGRCNACRDIAHRTQALHDDDHATEAQRNAVRGCNCNFCDRIRVRVRNGE
jgi:hypothetical protein